MVSWGVVVAVVTANVVAQSRFNGTYRLVYHPCSRQPSSPSSMGSQKHGVLLGIPLQSSQCTRCFHYHCGNVGRTTGSLHLYLLKSSLFRGSLSTFGFPDCRCSRSVSEIARSLRIRIHMKTNSRMLVSRVKSYNKGKAVTP